MPYDNYTDFQQAVLSQLGRPGDSSISGQVPDAITLFEADANQKLRTHWQEEIDAITTVSGTDTYSLPDDFLALREVRLTSLTPLRVLKFYESAEMDARFPWGNENAPIAYTLEGSDIRFAPIPDSAYTIEIRYFGEIPALANADTNWLITASPRLYLFGTCAEMAIFLGGSDDDFSTYVGLRDQAYQDLRVADLRYRTGGAPMQMKSYLTRGY